MSENLRYLQSQSSSNDATSLVSSGVSSEQSLENTRSIKFSTHAKEETKRVKAISLKLPKNKRSKFRKVHLTSKYKTGPYIITMSKLWAIIYLALRYHNEPMQLGDMIRYGREGHLSYYRLDHLLPAEINLTKTDINFLSRNYEMTHKGMRHTIAEMAKFLGVYELSPPNLLSLITRYCTELQLPRGVLLYAERLLVLTSPKMTFDSKKSLFPNYEGRVMAFIIVILKLIFSLDGITEYKISQTIANINRADTNSLESKLFNFYEWQCYIECRKAILTNIHLPTKLKYYPDSLDIKSLYIQFLKSINLKNNRPVSEQTDTKHHIPHDLANLLHQCVKQLNESDLPSSNKYCLVPSTTPMHSYMQQVLVDSFEYPIILQNNFFVSKVGYATKSEFLQKIAEYSSITLKTIDSNLHFVEKVVPFFEKTKMLTANELKEGIELKINTLKTKSPVKETETLIDYNNKKIPCLIKIDKSKQIYFDYMQQYTEKPQRCDLSSLEDFEFESVLPNGKLIIPSDPEWDSESDENEQIDSLSDVNTKYNLHLSSWEEKLMDSSSSLNTRKDEILRPKPLRDNLGRFLKSKAEKKKSKAYRSILNAKNKYANEAESFDEPDLKTYNKLLLDKHKNINNIKPDDSILFRPYTQYWMYHCIFSKVKPKNFDLFQRSLPITFRWLLMECAKTIEMSTEDLYEEVCLLEAYLVHVLKPRPSANSDISSTQVRSNIKSEQNIAIRSKW
ncbi:TATA box-binding protein-associated factor RNA polymerase I subunit B isoform X2 [Prorops nasuta]|uniref:TATA box-binding protein-associated factor RNA polymerase I subunit B isoform X2 n=1 Tax=Prorops nasuta TaxID=863751 RepID=UPI0034CE7F33